ncbi:MAG TPA: class I SAM-dependent methyltransferase [Candidatus Acidoferrales bacterium]|nr:class I SAM-dependent methyltransferase [Candidatus Acidoferrales bacterium]
MSMLGKLRPQQQPPPRAPEPPRPAPGASLRHSNGLKDFLWLIPERPQGRILDLGPVAQATVSFFTDRNFRVSTEDLVRSWVEFRDERERNAAGADPAEHPDPAALAADFLKLSLRFDPETFHGILAWDAFDFLESELLHPLAARLHQLLAPGGVLLAAFHDAATIGPSHYRVRDGETLELVPSRRPPPVRRVFQNREILALFGDFRSSRTFVGRDHLREALFLK